MATAHATLKRRAVKIGNICHSLHDQQVVDTQLQITSFR